MALNESEIARYIIPKLFIVTYNIFRQMTMIESRMFLKIRPSELLHQSWNKTHLQHKAPNILAMISRANKVLNILSLQNSHNLLFFLFSYHFGLQV